MASTQITIQLQGSARDNGDVRFGDFIKQLSAVKKALGETDRVLSQTETVYYRVVDLRHNSPAQIVLEAVKRNDVEADNAAHVVDAFISGLSQIAAGIAPDGFDYYALQSYKEMTNLIGKGLADFTVRQNGTAVSVSSAFGRNIDVILGPDRYEMGSVTGLLQQINLHDERNIFTIYPTIGQSRLRCIFPQALRTQAVGAVDRYIKVFGQMKYKTQDKHPYEMMVQSIEVYPPAEQLPKLSDLWGIAPDALEGQSTEDFIRNIRHEW